MFLYYNMDINVAKATSNEITNVKAMCKLRK